MIGRWLCVVVLLGWAAAAWGLADVDLVPTDSTFPIGADFDVAVRVQTGTQAIRVVEIHIDYNPDIVTVTSITDGTPPRFAAIVNNSVGHVDYTAAVFAPTPPVAGSFTVVTLHCHAMAVGFTPLTFQLADSLRHTAVFLDDQDVTGTITNGSVRVTNIPHGGGAGCGPASNPVTVP